MKRIKDLTGQRFGWLVVVSRSENKGNKPMWHCRCDCGNEKDISHYSLTRVLTKSCGCLAKETTSRIKYKDITGNRYGMFVVLERVDKPSHVKKNGVYYSCQCDCGNVFVTEKSRIVSGGVKSCGCYKSKSTHERFFKDISGEKFGRLFVLEYAGNSEKGIATWKCLCDCGNIVIVNGDNLRSGNTKSCGCLRDDTIANASVIHGKSKSRLYRIYNHMKGRCCNKDDANYDSYGGRGIIICQEWLDDFMSFYKWAMENGYNENLSIDRINNDGNYEPSNCRWADNTTQCNNRRSNRLLTVRKVTHTVAEWSRITGIGSATIIRRLNNGDCPEMALRSVKR